jgi:O-antigen ligase
MLAGILALICYWFALENLTFKKAVLYLIISLPFLTVLLLSKSRAPQLTLLLTLPALIYCHPQHIKKIISATLIFILFLIITYNALDFVKDIFYRPLYAQGNYMSYRLDIWPASLKEGFEYFWFGQGVSHKPPGFMAGNIEVTHSHNILLSVFRMGGILGVCLFTLSLSLCLITPFKQANKIERIWSVWLIFGLLCLLSNGKYPLSRPSSAWFALWIPIAFICASCSRYLPIKYPHKT